MILNKLRPFLRSMKKLQYFDPLRSRPHAVDEDERRPGHNKFPCAAATSDATDLGMIRQHVALLLDLLKWIERSERAVFRDIVYGMAEIGSRSRQPNDLHPLSPLTRARSSAR